MCLILQTNDTSWEYSLGIIIFDFIAFFYIFVSYVIIYYDATQVGATARNDDENRTMQVSKKRVQILFLYKKKKIFLYTHKG